MIDKIQIKIRGYHIDSYGHVNNSRYLEFLEEARWSIRDKYLKFLADNESTYGIVAVNNNVDYLSPAFLGDVLRVETEVIKIGTKSIVFQQDIYNHNNEKKVLHGQSTFVFYNRTIGQSEPLPEQLILELKVLVNENFET